MVHQADVVILSCVRSNQGGSIGFLSNVNRINVAVLRARASAWWSWATSPRCAGDLEPYTLTLIPKPRTPNPRR